MNSEDTPQVRFDRRHFLGLGAMAAGGLALAACGGSSSKSSSAGASGASGGGSTAKQTGPLLLAAEQDNSGTLAAIVKQWNAANPDTPVTYQSIPPTTNDVYSQYVTALSGGASTPDILTLDVTYPGTFASAGWLKPLDTYISPSALSGYTPSALDIGKYNGKLYALPQYVDVGQLYYRTDLLEKYGATVPTTFDELVSTAKKIQDGERATNPNFWGFVWEGAQIEAAFDEFCEWTWGYGGELASGKKVTLDTPQGKQALQFMHDTVYTHKISPKGTSTMKPNDAVVLMQNGNAAFMRNWTFAYALLNSSSQSKVTGKVANANLPGSSSDGGHGCIGGWMFGINAKSSRPEAAWRFIEYVTAKPQQIQLSTGAGVLSALTDVQTDPTVLAKSPNLKNIPGILAKAKSRPSIKNYPQVSSTLQAPLNSLISGQSSVGNTISTMQSAASSATVA